MAAFDLVRSQRKRTAKKIFSPADSSRYSLIHHVEENRFEIVRDTDILEQNDNEVRLRNGIMASMIINGKKNK